jgi:hypothetical protein
LYRQRCGTRNAGDKQTSSSLPFTQCGDEFYICTEPLYKTAVDLDLVDISAVDAILISAPANLLGLPFITELSTFRGKVYALEPTIVTARHWMEEIVAVNRAYRSSVTRWVLS